MIQPSVTSHTISKCAKRARFDVLLQAQILFLVMYCEEHELSTGSES